jgi:hypothetical protein
MQQCEQRLSKKTVGIAILVLFFDAQKEVAMVGAPTKEGLLFGMSFNEIVRKELTKLGFSDEEIDECGAKAFVEHRLKNGSIESPEELEATYRKVLAENKMGIVIDQSKDTGRIR